MKKFGVIACGVAPIMAAIPVMANEATGTANSAVVTAVTTTANDMLATGNAVIPIALGVIGLSLVVNYGIRLFRKNAKP